MGMTRYFEEFQVGERIISRSRTLEMADIRMYSACTSLCARIHSDPVYCRGIPALKRITVPYSLVLNVVDGLVVYPKVIYKHFMAEIPFMATENIMMDAVKEGGNRQELHEKIRQLSMQAGKTVKEEGKDNNLVDLIAADPAFGLTKEQIEANLKPELYVGRAPRQVEVFLRDVVRPVLDAHKEELGVTAEINV